MATATQGRPQQRLRTRKDLLQAAALLMQQGRSPSLEEVAAQALVSRATAYRYFPDVAALLAEASLDMDVPGAEDLFGGRNPPQDPVARLERVDDALYETVINREPQMRTMLAHAVTRALGEAGGTPPRQNRRSPMIAAALAPAKSQIPAATLRKLEAALAMIIGTEGVIVTKDVLRLDDAEARRVRRWAIRALVEAAHKPR